MDGRADLTLAPADLGSADLEAFVAAHLEELRHTAPAESRHAKPLVGLQEAAARMWVARSGGRLVGMAALVPVEPGHEEVKSMRTDPASRGLGIGRRLLDHLLEDAHARGVGRVSLETGTAAQFAPARRLYASAGFEVCGPFGGYVEDPHSVFMSRP